MAKTERVYDPRCEELARYFAPAHFSHADIARLAQAIQDAVDEFLDN